MACAAPDKANKEDFAMKNPIQLNIRIPSELKKEGDEVLRRHGYSASDVVRCVWTYMAEKQKLPDCVLAQEQSEADEEMRRKLKLISETKKNTEEFYAWLGVPRGKYVDTRTIDEQKDAMYEELLAEYDALPCG